MKNEIADGVFWIGVHFPQMGASLNAFLIKDKKTALIDTGAIGTQEMVLENIRKIVDPSTIDYVVVTHGCIDHMGGLKKILEVSPNAKLVASQFTALGTGMYGIQTQPQVMNEGEVLDLGKRKLKFISAPHCCRMDSVFVYEETEKILFTADAFGSYGQLGTEWKLFAEGNISDGLKKYNQMVFGAQSNVANAVKKIKDIKINIIAPGHGSLLKTNIDAYINVLSR